MLAKQLWRIIDNPTFLLSRILKHKYFPSSDVFSVEAGAGSSYTWRSVLAAKDLIIAGTRWQIGSGNNMRIWMDRWIPRPLSFQIITIPNTLYLEETVAVLLDEVGKWKEALIRAIFHPDDVDAILGITANSGSPNYLCWHYEKNRRYSVKSGYRLLHQGLAPSVHGGGTGSTSYQAANWKFIWRARVPPKVRLFAWRACRNSPPTITNLAPRGVNVGGVCPWCGFEEEDVLHSLL
ncbi:UNVERIFIED_CONTAM: hypothetical protein Slati_0072500 [Sesamum latifolium]|uniref:Reverse transcriptase zinc-binding domain-containing protein n=1 Tax=Sesamum latifolium TaxID=2727402 RepID=A0AAW2Y827_9LAMI